MVSTNTTPAATVRNTPPRAPRKTRNSPPRVSRPPSTPHAPRKVRNSSACGSRPRPPPRVPRKVRNKQQAMLYYDRLKEYAKAEAEKENAGYQELIAKAEQYAAKTKKKREKQLHSITDFFMNMDASVEQIDALTEQMEKDNAAEEKEFLAAHSARRQALAEMRQQRVERDLVLDRLIGRFYDGRFYDDSEVSLDVPGDDFDHRVDEVPDDVSEDGSIYEDALQDHLQDGDDLQDGAGAAPSTTED